MRLIGQKLIKSCKAAFFLRRIINECLQIIGNKPEFVGRVNWLSGGWCKSGPPLSTAAAGMPSSRCRVPGLKVARRCAIVLTSKDIVDKAGFFLLCIYSGSLAAAGAAQEAKV